MNKHFNNLAQANAKEYKGTAKLITYLDGRIQIKFHQQTNYIKLPKNIKFDLDKYNPDNRSGLMRTSCYLRQTTAAQKRYFDIYTSQTTPLITFIKFNKFFNFFYFISIFPKSTTRGTTFLHKKRTTLF